MKKENNLYDKYYSNLLEAIKKLYSETFKDKNTLPKTLNQLSSDLLQKKPNLFFFKIIEIKTYYKAPEEELDLCFPGNYYLNEDKIFKTIIFEFLYQNFKDYENNDIIIKGIKHIIEQLPRDSFHKKYVNLISDITYQMDEENKILSQLLVTTPYRYNDLIVLVDNSLDISPLPDKAAEFYSLSKYKEIEIKLKSFLKKRSPIEELREEMIQLTQKQNQKIKDLELEVLSLKQQVKETQNSLFIIQLRDIIKAFISQIKISFNINERGGEILEIIKSEISRLTEGKSENEKKGTKMIMKVLEKLFKLKGTGDDLGNIIKNIGFNENILPINIKENYLKYKSGPNCQVKNCDCIALILSIKEINDSNNETTKKKYNLFKNLFDIPWKDWDSNRKEVIQLLVSY